MQVIVIGGGAAGFFGSIACATANPDARVTLLEASRKPLHKVRISGGGRCNVTHACFDPVELVKHYPRGEKALRGPLTRFQPRDTVRWFEERGVKLKTESDGRMFPTTDNSETIARCLFDSAIELGVVLAKQSPVVAVRKDATEFVLTLKGGETRRADRILLATGSSPKGYQLARELGHSIVDPVPSLFTFNIVEPMLNDLAGVSVPESIVRLPEAKLSQSGPLLVTHWGLSGPAILKLSAWGARFLHDRSYRTPLVVNWLPKHNPETLRQHLLFTKSNSPKKSIGTFSPVELPRRLWLYHLVRLDIDTGKRWAELSKKEIDRLVRQLLQCEYSIAGKGIFKDEFVTCGGVKLKEVNFKTLESRRCPNLYFAGEILDIDGVTGGFNFQNAWTTGWLAGRAMGTFTVSSEQ
ncbi:MAG: NAD(P)/FAD-dependent oxidoreductase [Cyanobacteria bacterium SID2]|nr:NAD(P)/FAD-dependent oxidoreductase [Cyanobacteria bacterium SID2]MBP0004006.1 NAD(P)/FAD-dependent oxidoreductase [Cyanobacteria bacterium SBC]